MDKCTYISSADINDAESKLYNIYSNLEEYSGASKEDFYTFLSVVSAERTLFLNEYCNYEFVNMPLTTVIKVEPK